MSRAIPNLKSLNLKVTYRSVDQDILREFYVPCLKNSTLYRRAVGYFTSAALSEAARGLLGLVNNNGQMMIIASPKFTQNDIQMIKKGYELREVVNKALNRGLDQKLDESDFERVRNLTWMISNGKLDIRIAFPKSEENEGRYHEKIGLFNDPQENVVVFSGSLNETAAGLISNYESIDVSVSWDEGERERKRVIDHSDHFEKLWKGIAPGLIVMDFSEAVRKKLIERFEPLKPTKEYSEKRSPYPFQKAAIEAWKQANYRGILSMATGSGKTYTALKAIEHCKDLELVLIIVPSSNLIYQWESEIRREYGEKCIVRKANSEEKDWEGKIERVIEWINSHNSTTRVFILATIQTASRKKFLQIADDYFKTSIAVVVDEVHHSGAPTFRKIFDIEARCRLGLSATPEREWDEEGNQAIFDYFGHVVFEYDISQAIKDNRLSKYYYYPHIVPLTYEERNEFNEASKNIALSTSRIHKKYPRSREMSVPRLLQYLENVEPEEAGKLRTLYLKRVEIVRKAENKFSAFRKIITNNQLNRCLVYCNDLNHLGKIVKIIFKEGFEPIEFSSRVIPETRKKILETFEKNVDNNIFLVAVKCLDEGIDIPACDSAILISCSRSIREFIQRRGRVLRKHPTKKFSTIHDIVILPFTNEEEAYPLTASEFNFIKEELKRVDILSTNAINNKDYNIDKQIELYRRYLLP